MTAGRVRAARLRAQRLGYRITKFGRVVEVWSEAEVVPEIADDLDRVEAWLADQWQRATPAPPGPEPRPVPADWREFIDLFTAEQKAARRSPTTIRTRIGHLTAFAHQHPHLSPLAVRREELVAWIGRPALSPRTAHSIRSTMRVFYRLLTDLGHLRASPAATLPAISLPRSLPRPCPDHAITQALAAAPDGRVRLALLIATETGLRRGEVARIHPRDVVGRAGHYRLHVVGKGGHEREVPISDELARQILAHRGHLFSGPDDQPITPEHLGKLCAAALPDGWTIHTLRHRFATEAYRATSDLRAVQELLGHTSPVTTAIYTKVADGAMRRAATAATLH